MSKVTKVKTDEPLCHLRPRMLKQANFLILTIMVKRCILYDNNIMKSVFVMQNVFPVLQRHSVWTCACHCSKTTDTKYLTAASGQGWS